MNNFTLTFIKNNKKLLFSLHSFTVFLGVLFSLNPNRYSYLSPIFTSLSILLIILDLWIIFCLLNNNIKNPVTISYKRLIEDIILVIVIFYNTIHVLLSAFISYAVQNLWFFFYGLYHLIFALALYNIFKNYKIKIKKNSFHTLQYTSYFIFCAALTFIAILYFVLIDSEQLNVHGTGVIFSLSLITLINLVLSIVFIFKLNSSSSTNFIAHKYLNCAASIYSLFLIVSIYLNAFYKNLPVDKMRIITLIVGVPSFFILLLLSFRLHLKYKKLKASLS